MNQMLLKELLFLSVCSDNDLYNETYEFMYWTRNSSRRLWDQQLTPVWHLV